MWVFTIDPHPLCVCVFVCVCVCVCVCTDMVVTRDLAPACILLFISAGRITKLLAYMYTRTYVYTSGN